MFDLGDSEMKSIRAALLVGCSMLVSNITYADDAKSVIAALTERLTKIGVPKIEGSDKAGADKTAPALYFGSRKVNNNYDVVDDIKKTYGATATVFVLDGQEFVRVSTNVLTPEGKRGVGTALARAKAYEAVSKGEQFCGDVDVLGTPFSACYNPLKDAGGKVIGATYVGFKK
jgi:Cache 3/Cache 2 fusion domain